MIFLLNGRIFFGLIICCLLLNVNGLKRVKRIVGGQPAAAPPPDDPVVFTRLYARDARVEGYRSPQGYYSFLGIRFVHPPIGEDRFRRPRFLRLEGDIDATTYGQPCPQPDTEGYIVGSEDCLWLNIFTPKLISDDSPGAPVVIWIHGGGYRYGSANQYSADALTSKGVLFVPIQYRLGSLGFLGDGTTEFSGNAALFDMAAAMRWVHEYIHFFGGDPRQVVVMGQGSGAQAATYLTTTQRQSREMVSGVVAMSGSPYSQHAIDDEPTQSTKEIAAFNNCQKENETEIVKCMRDRSFEDIIREDSKVQIERLQGHQIIRSMNGNVGFQPLVEGRHDNRSVPGFLDDEPRYVIGNGTFKKVPLLTGVTLHETANAINVKNIEKAFTNATKFLGSLANSVKKNGLMKTVAGTLLPGLEKALSLTDYLKVPKNLNPMQIMSRLTEATTDALFNLPAILTAQTWTKKAPAFLYSFEHVGKSSNRGSTFLSGLPIVANSEPSNDTVGHGDELAYLFDARDIFGKNLTNTLDETDKKVRENFSNLIAKFASFGKDPKSKGIFQAFSADQSNFIRIGKESILDKDFRFCQLSLWGASIKPSSKSTSCKFILNQLASSLLTATGNLTSSIGSTLDNTLGGLSLGKNKGGVLSNSLIGTNKNSDQKNSAHNNRGGGGLLGIF